MNGGQHWILSILRRDILWKNKNSKFIFLKLDKHTHTHTHTHKIWFDICKTQYIKADPFSLLQNKDPRPIQTSKYSVLILLLKLTRHSNTKNLQLKAGFSDEQNLIRIRIRFQSKTYLLCYYFIYIALSLHFNCSCGWSTFGVLGAMAECFALAGGSFGI